MSQIPVMAATPRVTEEEPPRDVSGPSDGDGEMAVERNAPHDPMGSITRTEWVIAAIAGVLLLGIRWLYAHSDIWNSDEPQHLHVVWSWANGYLPYRDFFDNHMPLFHVLSVPLFRALGERADIVLPMRLAMTPLLVASLWCIYRIGANVFSPRAGLWSALLLGSFPLFFQLMGQYRTDVLWTGFWVASLAVLTSGSLTPKRLFFTGLIVGAAFGVSMKTVLLLLVMVLAGAVTGIVWRIFAPRDEAETAGVVRKLAMLGAGLCGLLIIPALIVLFFYAHGSLRQMYYCIVVHNTLPGDSSLRRNIHRLISSPASLAILPALAFAAFSVPLFKTEPRRAARQIFLILCAGFFCPVLYGFWRMITLQDFAPWYPLVALVAAPVVLLVGRGLAKFRPRWGVGFAIALLFVALVVDVRWLVHHVPIFGSGSTDRIAAISEALRLTKPGEFVMDPKGDLIFRPRPYYFVLETLTKKRLKRGLIKDDLPQTLIDTRTAVIETTYSRMSPSAIRFVQANYVPVGYLDVLGKKLAVGPDGTASFDVVVPERYLIVARDGDVAGTLDGQPLDGARALEAGPHQLKLTTPAKDVVLLWARAQEKGFSPFDPPPPGHTEGDVSTGRGKGKGKDKPAKDDRTDL
jgi:hypothetical protein